MFKKIISSVLCVFLAQTFAFADDIYTSINNILNSYDFERDSVVSVSISDKNTKSIVYTKNRYKMLNPASALKVFTMASSINTLGEDYSLNSTIYKNKNDIYLKLSGDPYLTQGDLDELCKKLKTVYKGEIAKFYIDDTIMDFAPYPDGWMADDTWPYEIKISPYMIDKNTVKLDILVDKENNTAKIVQKNAFEIPYINKLKVSDKTNIKFTKDETYNALIIEGEISDSIINKELPVINPKAYFCSKLQAALIKNGITTGEKFFFAPVPKSATPVAKINHSLFDTIKRILSTSDNIGAEMIFKIAGGKYALMHNLSNPAVSNGSLGTTENGIIMFNDYYENLGLDKKQVSIKDASGVSRYNAISVDWMASALSSINFNIEKYLPAIGEGTLSRRLRELNGEGHLKTGTLKGLSSLVGTINIDDNEYYYASIIMSMNRASSVLKGVEDEIIYEIYRMKKNENK